METSNLSKPIPVKCTYCSKDFSSSTILFHNKKHHPSQHPLFTPKEISCDKCFSIIPISFIPSHILTCPKRFSQNLIPIIEEDSGDKSTCRFCMRKFISSRIEKHESACEFSSKKRPVFDMHKKRSPFLSENSQKVAVKRPSLNLVYHNSKWQKQHLQLMKNLKCEGDDSYSSEYLKCGYCQRKFAVYVYDKHIEICKKLVNRPSGPLNNPSFPSVRKRSKNITCSKELGRSQSVNKMNNEKDFNIEVDNFEFKDDEGQRAEYRRNILKTCSTLASIDPNRCDNLKIPPIKIRSISTQRLFEVKECQRCSAVFPVSANFCMMCGKSKKMND